MIDLDTSIGSLDLSVRSYNNLSNLGIYTVGALTAQTRRSLLKSPGMGRVCLDEIEAALEIHGLGLGNSWMRPHPELAKSIIQKLSALRVKMEKMVDEVDEVLKMLEGGE